MDDETYAAAGANMEDEGVEELVLLPAEISRKPKRRKRSKPVEDGHSAVGKLVVATHGSPAHPLRIGDIEIPCYVLEDERRVITQRGMLRAMGLSVGGTSNRIATFAAGRGVSAYLKPEAAAMFRDPIRFRIPVSGGAAYGYEATLLADLCDAVLGARQAGALMHHQEHVAQNCEILVRSFARVGIIALVDEATGFQRTRTKDALARILEMYISKELASYASVFTDDFYYWLFKLRGWDVSDLRKRPGYTAELTKNLVYRRLAPGVLVELQRVQIRSEKGRPKHTLYQRLTENHGYPRLKEHLAAVVALMRVAPNWKAFMSMLDRALPRQDVQDLFPGEGYGAEADEAFVTAE